MAEAAIFPWDFHSLQFRFPEFSAYLTRIAARCSFARKLYAWQYRIGNKDNEIMKALPCYLAFSLKEKETHLYK